MNLPSPEVMQLIDSLRIDFDRNTTDPVAGYGAIGERTEVPTPLEELPVAFVPVTMLADERYPTVLADPVAWKKLRCIHDFEYWAATCVVIKDKMSQREIPFILNAPQRRTLQALESHRLAGEPIRAIVLKARQWGGSTLVQMYMAWIQSCHRTNWHSVICAHVKNAAYTIRGMYTKMLEHYPRDLWEGDQEPRFAPFEQSADIREIKGRDCRVTIGTCEKPDNIRGGDYAMAHLSESAFWPDTPNRSARSLIRSVCGSVAMMPYSLIVIESTANGVGDFFHNEWLRSKAREGDKIPVFVPWHEISFYRAKGNDAPAILSSLTHYEQQMWIRGATTEMIRWRRHKLREINDLDSFNSEFPGTDIEAFVSSTSSVFSARHVEDLRAGCVIMPRKGEIDSSGTGFADDPTGCLSLWEEPRPGASYVAAVDVGGRSAKADWSVVAVLEAGPVPKVVAQWRGHVDHDILAAKAMEIGRYYNNALLVIESNTFETEAYGGTDSNLFILARLAEAYPNVYRRQSFDRISGRPSQKIGFHTNRATKGLLIAGLIEAVREGLYIERDPEACNEFLTYATLPNGSYAAKEGHHDDILMTRAIALHVLRAPRSSASATGFTQRPHW